MIRLLICLFALVALFACGKPPGPAPTSQPAKPMVIVVAGFGNPCTADVSRHLREVFKDHINLIDFATGMNSYRGDVGLYANSNPHGKLILIGHSYGVSKIFQVLDSVGPVSLVIDLDGVKEVGQSPFVVPSTVGQVVVITGDFLPAMLVREPVRGVYAEYKVHRSHSEMPGDFRTLSLIESYVRGAI